MSYSMDAAFNNEIISRLAQGTVVGIYCVSADGSFKYVNNGFSELFGYTHEELYKHNLFELIHPDDIATVREQINIRLQNGVEKSKYEIKGIKKDKSLIYIGVHGHVLHQNDSQSLIMGTMVDITESKRIKNELKQTTHNFQSLIQGSPLALVALDLDMKVKLWNRSAEIMFGWEKEEVIGQPYPIIPDFDKENFQRMFSYITSGNSLTNVETKRKTKKGSLIDVCVSTSAWYDNKGNKNGYMAILQDISDRKVYENELAKIFKKLSDLEFAIDASSTVSITDSDGKILFVNDKFCEVSKFTRDELIGQTHRIINSGYHPKEYFQNLRATIKQGKVWNGEVRNRSKDGGIWWANATVVPFLDENHNPYQYIAIRSDITDRKMMEEVIIKQKEELEEREQRFRTLVQNSSDVIVILDINGKINFVSLAIERITGFKHDVVHGASVFDFVHPDHMVSFKEVFAEVLKNPGKVYKEEHRLKTANGNWRCYEIIFTNHLHVKSVKGISVNFRDITEKKQAEEKIKYMAFFDYLTDLPNRRLFEEELKQRLEFARDKQSILALLFLDLDGFKNINDTLGHDIGDKLLRAVASRLNESQTETTFISRFGGDEFTIIISDLKEMDEIEKIAKHYLSLFEHPFLITPYELFITTSIGISLFPNGGDNFNALIQNADLALYRAKDEGKNKFEIFSPTMNVGTYKKFSLQNDLRKAVQEKEMFLLYQPKIDSKTHKIVGAEALVRWKHPEWGIVSPEEFIPLAEQSGFINIIGEQVLYSACLQNKKWQDDGHRPIKMAINFSPIQFLQADIVEVVKTVLHETELEPKWLEIEITETAIMKNEASTLLKIKQLRDMGVSIAIDDFGTGFSSLSYLQKIKPDTVKIDKSFIRKIPNDVENVEIVTSIIHLAEKLKINIVAEGVETLEQTKYLTKMHCKEIQGYFFSKPILHVDFEKLLKKGKCLPGSGLKVDFENRRYYFRIDLPRPLIADMTITSISGKKVNLGMTKVLIENIGPGGLRFISNVILPPRPDLYLKMRTYILEEKIEVTGSIVWIEEVDDIRQYGFEFNLDENERGRLTSILNQLQVKLRNKMGVTTSWFLSTSKQEFFNSINGSSK